MVLCRDKTLAHQLHLLRDQGFQEPRFVHEVIGFNYRMTNIQAAIGLAQTEKAKEKVAHKRWIGQNYNELLSGQPDLTLPSEAPWAKSVYWMYGVLVGDGFGVSRNDLIQKLKEKGIETRPFFHPMHLQPAYKGGNPIFPDRSGAYPVSTDLGKRGLYLPSGLSLSRINIEQVVKSLLGCRK